MKKFVMCFFLLASFSCYAQLSSSSKIYLEFAETKNEVNVNGEDALNMLADYVKNKTTIEIVNSSEGSDFTMLLSVYERNMGNRMGKIEVINSTTKKSVFESKWKKGTMNAFYGYSGTRHAIGRVFKGQFLNTFPNTEK